MKEPQINSFFGKRVYQSSVDSFEKLNKDIIPYIKSFMKEKPGSTAATTDVEGSTKAKDDLHHDKKFKKIFNQIRKHVQAYLKAMGYNQEKFDAHIVKAWTTYTAKGQYIASHNHTASHLSVVYYILAEDMGGVKFEEEVALQRSSGLFIPRTNEYFKEWNQFNFASYLLEAKSGNIIIFPSILLHHTEKNTKNKVRISLSADVLLTMKKGIKTEHCISHPDGWLTL